MPAFRARRKPLEGWSTPIELGPATADEMILEFVKAEQDPLACRPIELTPDDRSRLVTNPDLSNQRDNAIRRRLLDYRGLGSGSFLFAGFPPIDQVSWHRAQVTLDELRRIRFAQIPEWLLLSGDTGIVGGAEDVIRRKDDKHIALRSGCADVEKLAAQIRCIADDYRQGKPFARLIAIKHSPDIILFEGYKRATAFALSQTDIVFEVLLGSADFTKWCWLPKG